MQFLSFEDTTAIYETTFFPKTYQKFCRMITKIKPYILKGYVDEDFSAVTLDVIEVEIIGEKRKPIKKPVEKDKKVYFFGTPRALRFTNIYHRSLP